MLEDYFEDIDFHSTSTSHTVCVHSKCYLFLIDGEHLEAGE